MLHFAFTAEGGFALFAILLPDSYESGIPLNISLRKRGNAKSSLIVRDDTYLDKWTSLFLFVKNKITHLSKVLQ